MKDSGYTCDNSGDGSDVTTNAETQSCSLCGDGFITGSETCDGGTFYTGIGCSSCVKDSGYTCAS